MTRERFIPLLGLAAAVTLAAGTNQQGKAAKVGDKVPSFALGKMINGDGRTNLDEFRGQPVMVDFWGTH